MTLSMGMVFTDGVGEVYRGNSLTPTDILDEIDAFKNQQADSLSLTHDDASSAQLYPATYALSSSLTSDASFSNPSPSGGGFPDTDILDGLVERGIVPVIWMQTTGSGWPGSWSGNLAGWDETVAKYKNWTNGLFDDYLDEWSTQAKEWAYTVKGDTRQGDPQSCKLIVRFNQEMNASFMPWRTTDGTGHTNNTPTKFKAAWQHIHDRIRVHNQATHVNMFFCGWPSDEPSATTSMTANYPGDDYCQYIGADVYCGSSDNDGPFSTVSSLRTRAKSVYNELTSTAFDSSLNIIFGECAVEDDSGDSGATDTQRSYWITGNASWGGSGNPGGYDWVSSNLSRVRVISYYNPYDASLLVGPWHFGKTNDPTMFGAYATAQNTYTTRLSGYYPSSLLRPRSIFAFG